MDATMALDKRLPVPLYHQLKTILLKQIESGGWKPHDKLPTEDELAATYGVSKVTVRQALRDLAELGWVRREQGRGTFVEPPKLELGPRELTSFTVEMQRHGWTSGARIIGAQVIEASGEIAEHLDLPTGAPVFALKRLRLAGAKPMGIQTAYLPLDLVPGLPAEPLENRSLYEVLQQYGLRLAHARETHFAVLLTGEDAKLLAVADGSPGLAAERVAYLSSGRPLEFTTSVMRGDRYRIKLELVNDAC